MSESETGITPPERCSHCGNVIPMAVVARHFRADDGLGGDERRTSGTIYELLSCLVCERVTPRSYAGDSQATAPREEVPEMLYPGHSGDPLLPAESMIRPYIAASIRRGMDPARYGVMIRRLAIIRECNRSRSI